MVNFKSRLGKIRKGNNKKFERAEKRNTKY